MGGGWSLWEQDCAVHKDLLAEIAHPLATFFFYEKLSRRFGVILSLEVRAERIDDFLSGGAQFLLVSFGWSGMSTEKVTDYEKQTDFNFLRG